MNDVHILTTGVANLASVAAMVERAGARPVPTSSADDVRDANFLVVPGVGSFAAGARALDRAGVRDALTRRIDDGSATFGICLGLQLLGKGSEEAPGALGLGMFDASARRISGRPSPQIGWNGTVGPDAGDYYFVNSFAFDHAPDGWDATWFRYGERYIAALRRDRVVATQFHPELSGDQGQQLFDDWLEGRTREATSKLTGIATRVIPCLDIRDGRVVKGVKFQGLRDAGDPVECARRYAEEGADEVTILDVSATIEGRRAALDVIRAVRAACGIPLTVGGGVRGVADAAVYLEAGADKVAINSAAVRNPAVVGELAKEFGRQCVVASVDARRASGRWEAMVDGGRTPTGVDAVALSSELAGNGAGELLITSFDRDGTGEGYDEELLAAVRRNVDVPIVASGGGRTAQQMVRAVDAGADAVLAATIFHDGLISVGELKRQLEDAGMEVRR